MVVAQLVERLLPTPDIHNLKPDIGKILFANCTIEKTKIKKKWLGMAHLKKTFGSKVLIIVIEGHFIGYFSSNNLYVATILVM